MSDARKDEPAANSCVARSVVDELDHEPTLEAVTINHAQKTISVATLGRADVPRIAEKISSNLERTQAEAAKRGCTLLEGGGDCLGCVEPLTEDSRKKITIRHDHGSTTIARVTCPTA